MIAMSTVNNAPDSHALTTYQAGVMQAAAHRLLQKRCDDILRPYGITKAQWLIIGTVLDTGKRGIRLTDLAAKLDTTLPYLTTAINLLESKDILERSAHDKDDRVKLVKVNAGFARKCQQIERTLREALRKSIYADVTPEEFHVYLRVLQKLSELK